VEDVQNLVGGQRQDGDREKPGENRDYAAHNDCSPISAVAIAFKATVRRRVRE
jgi:hypothetical protein